MLVEPIRSGRSAVAELQMRSLRCTTVRCSARAAPSEPEFTRVGGRRVSGMGIEVGQLALQHLNVRMEVAQQRARAVRWDHGPDSIGRVLSARISMPITIARSRRKDRPAIIALMNEARGDDLSDDERAMRGFVQGRMDEALLARFQSGTGVFVARDGSSLAGFCMTSTSGMAGRGPPGEMLKAITRVMPEMPLDQIFLYGPVAVDRGYQGKGLLTRLLVHACKELRARFRIGALFVEHANRKSLAIHRHYPMDERTTFTLEDRSYAVFTFAPDDIIDHYR